MSYDTNWLIVDYTNWFLLGQIGNKKPLASKRGRSIANEKIKQNIFQND